MQFCCTDSAEICKRFTYCMKLGITNFRVFKDRQEFDIRPITLLTGPNNSGKSAFTKLLELLKLGTQTLNFNQGRHNLGGFENAINWSSNKKEFTIDFNSDFDFFSSNMTSSIVYNDGKAKELTVSDDEKEIFTFKIVEKTFDFTEGVENNGMNTSDVFQLKLSFDYKYVLEKFLSKKIDIASAWDGNKIIYTKLADLKNVSPDITFENYRSYVLLENDALPAIEEITLVDKKEGLSFATEIVPQNYYSSAYLINNVVSNLNLVNSFALYDIFINGENVTKDYVNMLVECQDEVFSDYEYLLPAKRENLEFGAILKFASGEMFKEIRESFLDDLIHKTDFDDQNDRFELVENHLYRLLFSEKIVDFSWLSTDDGMSFYNQFLNQQDALLKSLSKVDFISAQRGNIERVLLNSDSLEMNQVLLKYDAERKKPDAVYDHFIKEAFEIFGIEGKLEVKSFENTIMIPYILKDGKEISFADLGFGFAQIVPIIVKIAITHGVSAKYEPVNNILIIEEPEANLHPNLQSKLADLFVLATNTFSNLRLIVETHSEYIIRKLQYFTARKEIAQEKSVVYYFNADRFVNQSEPKVKKIEISNNGVLTDEFGTGFFDEAIRLRFDLMKLNSEQLN